MSKKIDALIARAKELKGYQVKAGVLKGATYPDTGQSVAQVAIWQEYGIPSKGVPPRPFVGSTLERKGAQWQALLDRFIVPFLQGKITKENVTTIVGGQMAADIRETIKEGVNPPLSPVTVMTRHLVKAEDKPRSFATVLEARQRVAKGEAPPSGDDTPLYDTHILYRAIDFE